MAGVKREVEGSPRKCDVPAAASGKSKELQERGAFTSMFERFRHELDEHYDRRERIIKASRDVTALSKKIIFALQRVRQIKPELPGDIQSEVDQGLSNISKPLAIIAHMVQGINYFRYSSQLSCMEELVEALTFAHYLKTQQLISLDDLKHLVNQLYRDEAAVAADPSPDQNIPTLVSELQQEVPTPILTITEHDYIYGILDLSGEMMRFATAAYALGGGAQNAAFAGRGGKRRTILQDMQNLGSFLFMQSRSREGRDTNQWEKKTEVMWQSVRKVERLGYDRTVRVSERSEGCVPHPEGDGRRGGRVSE